ncbi:MAG: transglutaminase-like domain-containing protein, partial [Patescibacteria group bacterium]|nr:transglutaminase-like domain-containing protein [Patescibacteria group bacterium]
MEKSPEQLQHEVGRGIESGRPSLQYAVERIHRPALEGESYEDASVALTSVEALQDFRKRASQLLFASFHEMVEVVTIFNRLSLSREEKVNQTKTLVEVFQQKAARLSPRVADLYLAMLAEVKGESYEPKFNITKEKVDKLKSTANEQGDLKRSDIDILFAGDVPWDMKLNRIETRLDDGRTGYLSGARSLDRREGKEMDDDIRRWREEELKKAPTRPPQRRNESKPGVDAMERLKEGERAPSIWSIYPAWGGYYKEQSFSKWDSQRNVWTEGEYQYSAAETVPLSGNTDAKKGVIDITLSARALAGQWVTLPIPYTHGLHKIEAGGNNYQVQQDQNGDLVIFVEGSGETEIKVVMAPHPEKKFKSDPKAVRVPDMPSEFSEETSSKLEEIKKNKRGNIARALAISSYVRKRVKYLAPKDHTESEKYNSAYNTHPKGFAGAVDELKAADCDVANTYFAALCAKLNIPVRHVVGHSVKGKDKEGASNIHSGTGHGWSEVWDEIKKEWMRMDATPAGDPNLEEQDEKSNDESVPGDYGEQEAVRPSDEQIEELRRKLAEHKEKLSYTKEERQIAEATGIEMKEAREIMKEIQEAHNTKLPNGKRIIDVMSKLFGAIVQSRKYPHLDYDGPVSKSEGGERIQNIVKHHIGIQSGESDPVSRERPQLEEAEQKIFGGFDLYLIGDKSGSMYGTADGESLWKMQRRAAYLILSSLYSFAMEMKRASVHNENALDVRTQMISFRGDELEDIDDDKPRS